MVYSPPTIVYDIYEAIEKALNDLPDSNVRAMSAMLNICDAIHDNERVYIPSGDSIRMHLRAQTRNTQIIKEFTGNNHKALAIRYNLTDRHIRRILDTKDIAGNNHHAKL